MRGVAVAHPVEQAEDANLLGRLRRDDEVAVVAAPSPLRRTAALNALEASEARADRDAERERAAGDRDRRPPGVDDADERRGSGPLHVARKKEERPDRSRPGREPRAAPGLDE